MQEPSPDSRTSSPTPAADAGTRDIPPAGGVAGLVRRLLPVHRGERKAVLLSALYFFFVLLSYYLLRPVREVMAIKRGYDELPWLMTGTLLAMAAANPTFSWLVSTFPRRVFIPVTYRFFALNMLLFLGLFYAMPAGWEVGLGYAFYIWLSVFNLFVVSVFWGLTADIYTREQATRLFGMIAIGGTLGAISGATITGWFVKGVDLEPLGVGPYLFKVPIPMMLAVAIVPLECSLQCVRALLRWQARTGGRGTGAAPSAPREPGPGMWNGLKLIGGSPYLLSIALYMLLYTITSTFLYMEQGRIVAATFKEDTDRIAAFAQLDQLTNLLTLGTQLFLTSQVMRLLGVGGTLCVLPVVTIAGFAALWVSPTFDVFKWFQVARRGLHYAVDRPARETLYTVLGPDEKYKSKSFIDTFVYRTGDMLGGWTPNWIKPLGIAVAWIALPMSAVWLLVGITLGLMQRRKVRGAAHPARHP